MKCFLEQTYENSHLLIYDTGKKPYSMERLSTGRITLVNDGAEMAGTIGKLRNTANGMDCGGWLGSGSGLKNSEVLIHWDSDDWSAPHRIEDEIKLLINSAADIVGYNDLLFWDSVKGEAWQFRQANHKSPIGTSLCYRREYWAKNPFKETSAGEDFHFVHCQSTSAMGSLQSYGDDPMIPGMAAWKPMLVAEIHGGNACSKITPGNTEWKRESGWDARLREMMKL